MAKLTHNPGNPHGFKTEGSLLLDQVLEHLGIERDKLTADLGLVPCTSWFGWLVFILPVSLGLVGCPLLI